MRVFSCYGMKNVSILFWRALIDSLGSTLSPSVRGRSKDALFISKIAENSSILHKAAMYFREPTPSGESWN